MTSRENNHVRYTPSNVEMGSMGKEYYEVWEGLPSLEFESTKARGGLDALVCRKDDNYVWVEPKALDALNQNRRTVFLATLKRGRGLNARSLTPVSCFEEGVEKAKVLNQSSIVAEYDKRLKLLDREYGAVFDRYKGRHQNE